MPPEYGIAQFYDQVYGDDPLKPLLPTSLDKMRSSNFNTDKLQSIFPTSGIMTNVPFGTSIDNFQGFTDKEDFSTSETEPSGIAKLFKFIQKFSPTGIVTGGLNALGSMLNFKDSPNYMPATIGVGGYTPQELNQMNALGGYYSEPMRAYRRNVNRISNLMQRAAAGKDYSQKNLDKLMDQAGMGDVDTGAMIDSIKANAGYEGGFDKSTGNYSDPYSDDTE